MVDLFQTFSISEILICIVLLALAIKGVISFVDWANERIKKIFNKEYEKIDNKKIIEKKL